jgi:SAM-dependent methyltransferase
MKNQTAFNREAAVMQRFWEEGARKHAYFCVASGAQYLGESVDLDSYFGSGERAVLGLMGLINWDPAPNSRLIEIGCGTGRETRTLARLFGSVDAIDISETMIARARKDLGNVGNIRLHVCNGTDLSGFADSSFDYAFSELVFRHIPERAIIQNYLVETARVLTPGGRFAYQYNGRRRFSARRLISGTRFFGRALVAASRRRLSRRTVDPGYTVSAAWRGRKVSAKDIRRTCAGCGLVVDGVLAEGSDEMWVIGHKPIEDVGA